VRLADFSGELHASPGCRQSREARPDQEQPANPARIAQAREDHQQFGEHVDLLDLRHAGGEIARDTHASSVPNRNSASGHLMAGSRRRAREISKAASAAPSRICETAIEKWTMAAADPNASQPAARKVAAK
jgi:hypothetical protein